MEPTIPVRISKRKARDDRLLKYQDLADFANLGDTPKKWRKFRAKCGDFFPGYLTDWIYSDAENWYEAVKDGSPIEWPEEERACHLPLKFFKPPLLLYRGLLRAVWENKDEDGDCLKFLLGFEMDATQMRELHTSPGEGEPREPTPEEVAAIIDSEPSEEATRFQFMCTEPIPQDPSEQRPIFKAFGKILDWGIPKRHPTVAGLPSGKPVVDGVAGTINWEFGCEIQRLIYDLMQERKCARVCLWRECSSKYFIAGKSNQQFCSPECTGERKREKNLARYHLKGKTRRQELTASGPKPTGRNPEHKLPTK